MPELESVATLLFSFISLNYIELIDIFDGDKPCVMSHALHIFVIHEWQMS